MAQIGKAIASRINANNKDYMSDPIDLTLIDFACLAHDLGHPPFGHDGERSLNRAMRTFGGFEGNAQTLRILCRLEKKMEHDIAARERSYPIANSDVRYGLNPTARSIASLMKYTEEIPGKQEGDPTDVPKGIYTEDMDTAKFAVTHVQATECLDTFKTIECSIMDLADDIAYSTHDLEDALRSGQMNLLDLLSANSEVLRIVADKANKRRAEDMLSVDDVNEILQEIFLEFVVPGYTYKSPQNLSGFLREMGTICHTSADVSGDGYGRKLLTSSLICAFLESVEVTLGSTPAMSSVHLTPDAEARLLVLKNFVFERVVHAPRMAHARYRSQEIVSKLFLALMEDGAALLPTDFAAHYSAFDHDQGRARIVSDFISGMTDRYALEFYCRLFSENPISVFKMF